MREREIRNALDGGRVAQCLVAGYYKFYLDTFLAWPGTSGTYIVEYAEDGFKPMRGEEKGTKQMVIEGNLNRPERQDMANRVYSPKGVCPTLTAAMGTGGDNVPLVIQYWDREIRIAAQRTRSEGDWNTGKHYQSLEVGSRKYSNAITTVDLDNILVEVRKR